jgi:hypothetical protein
MVKIETGRRMGEALQADMKKASDFFSGFFREHESLGRIFAIDEMDETV